MRTLIRDKIRYIGFALCCASLPLYIQPAIEQQTLNPLKIYSRIFEQQQNELKKKSKRDILYNQFLEEIDTNQDGVVNDHELAIGLKRLGYEEPVIISKIEFEYLPKPSLEKLELRSELSNI